MYLYDNGYVYSLEYVYTLLYHKENYLSHILFSLCSSISVSCVTGALIHANDVIYTLCAIFSNTLLLCDHVFS